MKPANFLFVKGALKLIDFGIASALPSNKTSVLKETQMGTLSYMAPEVIKGDNSSGDDSGARPCFKVITFYFAVKLKYRISSCP